MDTTIRTNDNQVSLPQLIQSAFHHTSSLLLVIETATNAFAEANQTALTELHYTKAELLTTAPGMVCPALANLLLPGNLPAQQAPVTLRTIIYRKANSPSQANVTVSTFEEAGRTYLLATIPALEPATQLQSENAFYTSLFNSITDAIVSTDEQFRITSYNQYAEELFGWEAAETIGKPTKELTESIYPGSTSEQVAEELFATGKWKGEIITHKKNGEPFPAYISLGTITSTDGNITGTVAVIRDQTERKQAELKIRQLNKELEQQVARKTTEINNVFARVSDAIIAIDTNWRYTYINQRAERLLKRPAASLMGKKIWDEYSDDSVTPFRIAYEQAMKTQAYLYFEEYYAPLNAYFENHIYPSPDGLSVFIKDATERKKAEVALADMHLRYNTLTQAAHEGMMEIDCNNTIVFLNDYLANLMGYTKENMIGRNAFDFVADDFRDNALLSIQRLQQGHSIRDEASFITREGNTIYTSIQSMPLFKNGQFIGVISTILDNTKQHTVSEQLLASEKRFKALVENGSDGIMVLNEKGKPIYSSPGFEKILGYQDDDALLCENMVAVFPEDKEYVLSKIEESLQNPGQPVMNVVYRMMHKNGQWKWLQSTLTNYLDNPAINGIVNNFTDISLVKQKEIQLSSIADNLNGVLFRYKINKDGTDEIVYASKGSMGVWGVPPEEAIANNNAIWDIILAEDKPAVIASIQASAREMKEWTSEWRIRNAKGSICWQRGMGNPHLVEDGSIVWDSIIIDISEHKKAEEQQAFQAHLLNTIGQAVIATDMQGSVNYWNKAAESLYGWTASEALDKNIIDLTPTNQTKQQSIQLMDELLQSQSWSGEITLQRKDGSEFLGFVSDTVITDNKGNQIGIIGISNNISEWKKKEREMALLLDNTEEAFVLLDEQLNIISYNRQFAATYQKYFNNIVRKGSSIYDYTFPNRAENLKKIYRNVLAGLKEEKEISLNELLGIHHYFSLKFFPAKDENNRIIGVFITITDITKRKIAEELAREEQRNNEALINTTDDLIWSVDTHFRLVAANEAFLKSIYATTGVQIRKGDNLMMQENFSPEWLSFWQSLYNRALSGESFSEEIHNTTNVYEQNLWQEIIFRPIVNVETVVGVACYARDISLRKQSEQRNHEIIVQQQLYTAIVQASEDGIISKDQHGYITSWNRGAEKLFGYKSSEVIGKHITLIIPAELRSEEDAILEKINRHEFVHNYETERVTKDGKRISISLTISPITNADNVVIGASKIVRDITERKRIEMQVIKSEQRFRTLFEQSLAGFYETTVSGVIANCNDAFAHMLKYDSSQELIRKPVDELYFSKADRTEFIRMVQDMNKIQNHEGVLKCKDGSAMYYIENVSRRMDEEKGEEIYDGIILDISEKKIAEFALKDSNEKYNLVAKATNDVIWDWNIVTGNVERSAESMYKVFGYTEADQTDSFNFWASKMHPDDAEWIQNMFAINFANPQEQFMDCEYRFQKADGTYAFVYDKGYIIRNQQGEPIRMIGAVQDISKLKESEMLLQKERPSWKLRTGNWNSLPTWLRTTCRSRCAWFPAL